MILQVSGGSTGVIGLNKQDSKGESMKGKSVDVLNYDGNYYYKCYNNTVIILITSI